MGFGKHTPYNFSECTFTTRRHYGHEHVKEREFSSSREWNDRLNVRSKFQMCFNVFIDIQRQYFSVWSSARQFYADLHVCKFVWIVLRKSVTSMEPRTDRGNLWFRFTSLTGEWRVEWNQHVHWWKTAAWLVSNLPNTAVIKQKLSVNNTLKKD